MAGMPQQSGGGMATSISGMVGMNAGVSSFGAPSPPPQRNNMFINNINPLGTQGLMGVSKQHPTSRSSVLASAINSGLPVNSYGGLGSAGGVAATGRSNHLTGFGSACKCTLWYTLPYKLLESVHCKPTFST